MTLEGTFRNGALVTDSGLRVPDGVRLRFEILEDDEESVGPISDSKLPPEHPDAPYDRQVELAILRESIAEMQAGGGRPWREVIGELSRKHGLDGE